MPPYSTIQSTLIRFAVAGALLCLPGGVAAQQPPVALYGSVRTAEGAPAAGANVFLLETLDGVVTDEDGGFHLRSSHRGPATLVVQRLGLAEARIGVVLPASEPVRVVVSRAALVLPPLSVRAGQYSTTGGETAALTSLDVVSTPGAHADLMQAIRSLPGLQPVGDGAALYVRGADPTETRVLLDGAPVVAPYRFESSSTAFGMFDPFQLSSIQFSSGGFSARHGNSSGGLVELESMGVPERRSLNATLSMAGASALVALPVTSDAGIRATANRSSTDFLFRLNGISREIVRAPEARNIAASGAWQYRPGGEVRVHAMDEWNRFRVLAERHSYSGTFSGDDGSRHAIISLVDAAGSTAIRANTSVATRAEAQQFGVFGLTRGERLAHTRIELSRSTRRGAVLRGGGSLELHRALLVGSYPADDDARPNARVIAFETLLHDARPSVFAELSLRPVGRVEIVPGMRADRSRLVRGGYVSPRFNAAVELAEGTFITLGAGRYAQAPHPLMFAADSVRALPPVRATHLVAGALFQRDETLIRLEVYDRSTSGISALDRRYEVRSGGTGATRGVDLFARAAGPYGLEARSSYSFTRAVRTDPDTDLSAASPLAVRHALVTIVDRSFSSWRVGGSLRHATGRPWTPVTDADYDAESGRWDPVYAAPFSAELPAHTRVDLSLQFLERLRDDDLLVVFASITNVLGRTNVSGYSYSPDYRVRTAVHGTFRRTVFAGISYSF